MLQDRRKFLKRASLGLSAAFLSPYIFSSCEKKPSQQSPFHNVGLQLYTVRDLLVKDPTATLNSISKIGYNHVETFGFENGKFWNLSVDQLKKILNDNKLKTYSGHYNLERYLSKDHDDKENIEQYVEVAHELGQQYIVAPITPMFDVNSLEISDYQYAAEQLNKLGEMAKKAGIKIAYHNHFWEFRTFANGTKGLDILIAFTEPDLVDFELDIYWIQKAGYTPQSYFEKYPDRFTLWHIKDMDRAFTEIVVSDEFNKKPMEEIFEHIKYAEVGNGAIDYINISKYANKSGLKYAFVEQDDIYIEDKFASIKKSYDYIQKHVAK